MQTISLTKTKQVQGFGPHLMIDCYEGNFEKLDSIENVYKVLDELPQLLGMKKIIRPYVIRYEGGGWDKGGICGFVLIAESHISIHTFPEDGFFTADIYSCKDFSEEKATDFFKKAFDAKKVETNFVKRGKLFARKN